MRWEAVFRFGLARGEFVGMIFVKQGKGAMANDFAGQGWISRGRFRLRKGEGGLIAKVYRR
jgi:hypothetical protein